MAGESLPMTSNYEPSILNKEVKSSSLMSLQCKLSDDEPLLQHPPRPTILKSLNKDPDPDLQLTPLKQREQPKSLLRSNSSNAKVRHRVRFQESFSSESEQEISNKISEVSISDTSLNYQDEHENQNNNSLTSESQHDINISAPNTSNCLFLDSDSGLFQPQLMPIEVIREVNHNKIPSTSAKITSDFLGENNAETRPAGLLFSEIDKSISLSKVQTEPIPTKSINFENSANKENFVREIKKTSKDGQPCEHGSSKHHLSSSLSSSAATAANSIDKEDDIFTQPKIHTSIILAQRIKNLQKKQPDLTCELKKNLDNSEARNKINEKAATKVDIGMKQDLYPGLISLDVTDLELEEASIVHKTTKVKNTKKQQLSNGLEPDLLEFFTKDLQKETADFSLPGMPNYSITNFQAPSLIAFDLYRHHRMWEELPGTMSS